MPSIDPGFWEQLNRFMATFGAAQGSTNSWRKQGDGGDCKDGVNRRVVLDEKYFCRIDKFDGDLNKCKGWLFDLLVVLGQVDRQLSIAIQCVAGR